MTKTKNNGIEIADIRVSEVEKALPAIAEGLEKYINLMDRLNKVGAGNKGFQGIYDDFFKIKQRRLSTEFYVAYYALMKKCKQPHKADITFPEILKHLDNEIVKHEKTWSVEASLCSKLLSVINTDMPVWDKWIRKNLKMSSISNAPAEKRIKKAIDTYACLCGKYETFFTKDKAIAREWIERFDNYPEIKPVLKEAKTKEIEITKVKKIDFILWQIR